MEDDATTSCLKENDDALTSCSLDLTRLVLAACWDVSYAAAFLEDVMEFSSQASQPDNNC